MLPRSVGTTTAVMYSSGIPSSRSSSFDSSRGGISSVMSWLMTLIPISLAGMRAASQITS